MRRSHHLLLPLLLVLLLVLCFKRWSFNPLTESRCLPPVCARMGGLWRRFCRVCRPKLHEVCLGYRDLNWPCKRCSWHCSALFWAIFVLRRDFWVRPCLDLLKDQQCGLCLPNLRLWFQACAGCAPLAFGRVRTKLPRNRTELLIPVHVLRSSYLLL